MTHDDGANELLHKAVEEACAEHPQLVLEPYYQMKAAALRLARRVLELEKPNELDDLAFNIADEHARVLIDSCCVDEEIDSEKWLSFGTGKQRDQLREDCSDEIDYLEARGMLHRHPTRAELVRIEEFA